MFTHESAVSGNQAKIISPPESKAWGLHEFTVEDLDRNRFRVFYVFATPEREKKVGIKP
jgi:hypothetical protein